MRIRIVSDGTPVHTKVFDADTGFEIEVQAIEWRMNSNKEMAVCKLTLPVNSEVELVGEGESEELFGKPCKDITIEDVRFMGNTKAKLGHCVSVRGTIECPHCGGRIAVEIEESIKNPGEEEESGEKDK